MDDLEIARKQVQVVLDTIALADIHKVDIDRSKLKMALHAVCYGDSDRKITRAEACTLARQSRERVEGLMAKEVERDACGIHQAVTCEHCEELEEELERVRELEKYLRRKRVGGRTTVKISTVLIILEKNEERS